ncbi:MAG: hypothetical protein AAF383_23085, partial [Cyanobacteria bacterium P01_A01_bin.83]
MSMKLKTPEERVHTVIVDDECEFYASSPFESQDQEEAKFDDFREFAVHDYTKLLGLQRIARCPPAQHSAEKAGGRMSANDIKLELVGKSMEDFKETKGVVAQLDTGEATAVETAEVGKDELSAADIKLESVPESEGDEEDAGTLQTQHGVIGLLGKSVLQTGGTNPTGYGTGQSITSHSGIRSSNVRNRL